MNEQQKRELLRRWLAGDAGLEEERLLRSLAEEDPFLAEAIQGAEQLPAADHTAALARIKNRLQEKHKRKPVVLWSNYGTRVAAAAAVLLLAGAGFWYLNRPEPQLAQQTEKIPAIPEAVQPLPKEDTPAVVVIEEPEVEVSVPPSPPPPVKDQLAEVKEREDLIESEPDMIEAEDDLLSEEADNLAGIAAAPKAIPESLGERSTAMAVPQTGDSGLRSATLSKIVARTVSGQVTDDTGEPLIGASVYIPSLNQGTVTDFEGNYRFAVPDTLTGLAEVSYTGYESFQFDLTDTNSYSVQLQTNALALDEVVVTGLQTEKKELRSAVQSKAKVSSADQTEAQPVGGMEAYQEYIQDNWPREELFMRGIKNGLVRLEFVVRADGTPEQIKVVQSLCDFCDKEAKRLLLEGPKWKPAGAKRVFDVRF